MKKAFVLIRDAPWYRREAFARGLAAAGYEVLMRPPENVRSGDVLVIWNRYANFHQWALQVEAAGGVVLVAENGYIGRGGSTPKFDVHPRGPTPDDYYALSIGGHNGSGTWKPGGPERFDALGLELKEWRREGGHILVCGQRGIGSPTMASPPDWHLKAATAIQRRTKRPVKVRAHPGNNAPKIPLELDLEGAWACVIWSSGSGVKALVRGVPVAYDAPHWICAPGALRLREVSDWEKMLCDDALRHEALNRMAWAQWTVSELFSGKPFELLLGRGDAP